MAGSYNTVNVWWSDAAINLAGQQARDVTRNTGGLESYTSILIFYN